MNKFVKPYIPKPGSMSEAALAYMQTEPVGATFSAADLAGVLGCASANVKNNLGSLIKHELVNVIRRPGAKADEYSLGEVVDPFDADERRGGWPVHRTVSAANVPASKPGPSSVFDVGAARPLRIPSTRQIGAPMFPHNPASKPRAPSTSLPPLDFAAISIDTDVPKLTHKGRLGRGYSGLTDRMQPGHSALLPTEYAKRIVDWAKKQSVEKNLGQRWSTRRDIDTPTHSRIWRDA